MGAQRGTHTRIAALDGVRGLAVAAVLLFHAEAGFATGGFLGVSAFFTLSGFLITGLLLAERRSTGGVALGAFWARRARRLLPAAMVALAGIVAFGATVAEAEQVRDLRGDVLSALGYVANWRFLFEGRDYSELFSAPSPAQHFWSLAIEEQFYVLFPLLLVALVRIGRGRLTPIFATLAAIVGGSVALSVAFADDTSRVYYGTDTRIAELLIGALLAVICVKWAGPRTPTGTRVLGALGITASVVIAYWWATANQSDSWLYRGGLALHAVLIAVIITAARADTPLARAFSAKPLVALGLISYGVYLYHWPVFLWISPERVDWPWVPLFLLRMTVTIGLAYVSYHLIENPIRHGYRIRGQWPRIAMPTAAVAVVGAALMVTASPPAAPFVLEPLSASSIDAGDIPDIPPTTVTTPPPDAVSVDYARPLETDRPLRALVVGDSVGVTFGRGLELWAAETGDAVVRNEARPWCALGRDLPRASVLGEQPPGEGCENWDERWPAIVEEFDPDVVFVMFTTWEVTPRKLPGASDYTLPGNPELDAWQLSEYQAATDILSAKGGRVDWFTIPCADQPIAEGDPLWHINTRTLPALAETRDAVRIIDLHGELCPNGQTATEYAGVADYRPDRAHFSDPGALAVARWVMAKVQASIAVTSPVAAVDVAALDAAPVAYHRPLEAPRPLRMMVVGDSVGLTLGRGFELWASNRPDVAQVRNAARKYCSLGRYAPRVIGMTEQEQGAGCDDWEGIWSPTVEEFDPDVVVVLFTVWEAVNRKVPGSDEFAEPGTREYDAWQFSEYQAAADVLSARGARVVWLNIPCMPDNASAQQIASVNRTIDRLPEARDAVHVVDLDAELCPDGSYRDSYRDVAPARPDGIHFSDPGAHAVADWLMGIVQQPSA